MEICTWRDGLLTPISDTTLEKFVGPKVGDVLLVAMGIVGQYMSESEDIDHGKRTSAFVCFRHIADRQVLCLH